MASPLAVRLAVLPEKLRTTLVTAGLLDTEALSTHDDLSLEELADILIIPKSIRWFNNSLHSEPHLTCVVVNVLEQGYFLCKDISAK